MIDVRIRQQPSLFLPCLLVILAFMYWKWVLFGVLVIACVVLFIYGLKTVHEQLLARAAETEAIRKRADRQLHAYFSGDPRATYGWSDTDGEDTRR